MFRPSPDIMFPQVGVGGATTQPQERERRLREDADADQRRSDDDHRRHDVREDMPKQHA